MRFFINDKEIKTVISGASLEGSIDLVSRTIHFAYVYSGDNQNFPKYKVKIGANVKLQNDKGENVFQGFINSIDYKTNENIVSIQAVDYMYLLLHRQVTGRFRGTFLSIINKFIGKHQSVQDFLKNLKNKINVISFGNLSAFDILRFCTSFVYGKHCKIYMDGNQKIKVFNYVTMKPVAKLKIGQEVISSSFSTNMLEDTSSIIAFDNKDVIAGCVIKIIDENGKNSGDFLVQSDRHVYTNTKNTMELQLKERSLL